MPKKLFHELETSKQKENLFSVWEEVYGKSIKLVKGKGVWGVTEGDFND